MKSADALDPTWQAFIEGPLYATTPPPWSDDAAFAVIAQEPGLRDSIGGPVAPALIMAIDVVRAMTGIALLDVMHARRPAQGLCLGFGTNAWEPCELLRVCQLDCVYAYEWMAEQLIDAAQTLQTLRGAEPDLPRRIRLHHGSVADLSALADASMRVVYTANVFTWEVPMTQATFHRAVAEILRVLDWDGVVFSRGSAGVLEASLAPHGRMLLPSPLVSVFQKR
jgi:hypothetical protein